MTESIKTRRRWFRFSLRTMFVVMTVVAVATAAYQTNRRKRYCDYRAGIHAGWITYCNELEAISNSSGASLIDYSQAYRMKRLEFHRHWFEYYQQAANRPWWKLKSEPDWSKWEIPFPPRKVSSADVDH